MSKDKLCPMKFSNSGWENKSCETEYCAWFSEYHETCAIHTINEIPQQLFMMRKK